MDAPRPTEAADPIVPTDQPYIAALEDVAAAARVFLRQTLRDKARGIPGIAMCELDDALLALAKMQGKSSW